MRDSAETLLHNVYDSHMSGEANYKIQFLPLDGVSEQDKKVLYNDCIFLHKEGLVDKKNYVNSALLTITSLGIDYIENKLKTPQPTANTINYNIGSIGGNAVIGTQGDVIITIETDLRELKELIQQKPAADREELEEMLAKLNEASLSEDPIKKGFLAKFSDALSKHKDVAIAVGGLLFKVFTAQT